MTEIRVPVTALRSAASQFTNLQSQASQQAQAVGAVPIGASDFGRFPGQAGLYAEYRTNVEQCVNALQEVAESLGQVHQGLMVTADLYEDVERQAQEAADEFFGGI